MKVDEIYIIERELNYGFPCVICGSPRKDFMCENTSNTASMQLPFCHKKKCLYIKKRKEILSECKLFDKTCGKHRCKEIYHFFFYEKKRIKKQFFKFSTKKRSIYILLEFLKKTINERR